MISPTIFSVFGFEVKWYSVLILVAIIISYFLITGESKRFQIRKEFLI